MTKHHVQTTTCAESHDKPYGNNQYLLIALESS